MRDTDWELLTRYTRHHTEDDFAEIVRRHVDLVHSAALRQVRSPQLAEEVAQSTFLKLAQHAGKLAPGTILSAWLYQVARREAIGVVRREARRQLREEIFTEMNAMNATVADWTHIEPLLDEAMHALADTDRIAVLLRYFENKSLPEVGSVLGVTDDAARKRVSRAVECLRKFFAKRDVIVSTRGLVVVISASAVQAAPVGLAATISTAATLAGTTLLASATTTASNVIAMTTLQKSLIASALVAAVGVGIYEARQLSMLREQVLSLQRQQAAIAGENEEAAHQIAALRAENDRLNRTTGELLRLRSEVGMLRQKTNELAKLIELNRRIQPPPVLEAQAVEQAIGNPIPARQTYLEAWMRAFLTYAKMNRGELPSSFEQAEPFWPNDVQKSNDFRAEQFEILYHGSLSSLATDDVIIFREKKLWRNPVNGRWGRLSVLADGRAQYGSVPPGTPDENFSQWEKEHLVSTTAQ
jgi:RNA polymerase sigma factor (sigma-70 family)